MQEIDGIVLRNDNPGKIIDNYSRKSKMDLRKVNKLYMILDDRMHTNLPESVFDMIYTNATMHAFESPDSMIADVAKKSKAGSKLFTRDSFKGDRGEGNFCSDPKCAKPLLTINEFLDIMDSRDKIRTKVTGSIFQRDFKLNRIQFF